MPSSSPRPRPHRPAAAAAAVLAAALLAGCSSSSDGSKKDAESVPVQKLTSAKDLSMPIEAYMFSSEQSHQIAEAEDTLVSRCMKRFGISYEKNLPPADPTTHTEHRYGLVDSSAAAGRGYKPDPASQPKKGGGPALDTAGIAVLTGGEGPGGAKADEGTGTSATKQYNGLKVPKGGCLGEARHKLTAAGGTVETPKVVTDIDIESYDRSLGQPGVKAVFKKWSACMKKSGYGYATPNEANNDKRWNAPTATPDEIAVAKADVACKAKNNVVGIWYAADKALQQKAVEGKAEQLADVRKGMQAELKRAAAVTG